MADLVLYLGITAVGYFIGSKVRGRKGSLSWTGKVQTVALTFLVVLMGMRMGSNEEITENLSTIGVSALVITVTTIVFSIAAIFLTRKLMGIDRYGRLVEKEVSKEVSETAYMREDVKTAAAASVKATPPDLNNLQNISETSETFETSETSEISKTSETSNRDADSEEKQGLNIMTFLIVGAVIGGMLAGYFIIRNAFAGDMETFDSLAGLGIKIGLCILLVFVGLDLGIDGTVVDNFKKVGIRILAFPAVVVVASLIGAVASGMIMGLSFKESLAIGAGFGWYSLAPGIIMEAGYLTASAVSFLHNVMRELLSILFIPVVAGKIGYIETTGMPGAAAMDVCLPIVEKSTRSDIAVYSFVSGVTLSILVPILVPLIVG